MMVAKNRAELLSAARAALGDDGHAGEIRVRGTGEVRGVPVTWARNCHASGAFVETVKGAISHSVGYDGVTGWCVDDSGMPGPLELDDLDEQIVIAAVWTGRWASGGVIIDHVAPDGSHIVVGMRAREAATRRYRLVLDAVTHLPRRLEPVGRDDVVLELDDFRPGGFGRLPYVARLREAWLIDTLRIEAVERTTAASSYAAPGELPQDIELATAEPPPAWRRTRGKVPLVRAAIDGRDAGWFVLDTGAGSLAIADHVAAARSLPELGRRIVRTSDGVAGAPFRTARTLQIGPATLHRPRFLELDLAAFSRAAGIALAGILGYDLFMRAAITIDADDGIAITRTAPDGSWIDLRFQDGCPVIAARVPGPSGPCEGLFAIDTGSAAAVTFAAGAAPRVAMRSRGRTMLRGVSGSIGARAGELPWIEIAGHRIEEVAAVVARPSPGASGDPSPDPRVLGSLGMAVLHHFTLAFDYPRRRLQLRRRTRAAQRAPRG
jgi:predicted aspartyl protease